MLFVFNVCMSHVLGFLQSLASQASEGSEVTSPVTPTLDFLGPEMADLQQLLATMTTGNG